jgi:AraC-like DNA-binding protein
VRCGIDAGALLAELRRLVLQHADRQTFPVDGLVLVRAERQSPPTTSIAEPMLAVVVQGAKQVAVGDYLFDYGAGDYLVVPVDLPVTGHFTAASVQEPFLGIGLRLHLTELTSLLVETGGESTLEPRRPPARPALAVSAAGAPLLDALARLLRLLDEPRDIPVLAPMIRREILWRLLTGDQCHVLREIGVGDTGFTQVARAIAWIRDHHQERFQVHELAARVNMSPSAFHRRFRAATTMSPIQFQKKLRLARARLLLAGNSDDVTGVAYAVGYGSVSQFSREYRREFGTPPALHARVLCNGADVDLNTATL